MYFFEERKDPRYDDPDFVPCPDCGYDVRGVPKEGRCPECHCLVHGRSKRVPVATPKRFLRGLFLSAFLLALWVWMSYKHPDLNDGGTSLGEILIVLGAYYGLRYLIDLAGALRYVIVDDEQIRCVHRWKDDITISWSQLQSFERKRGRTSRLTIKTVGGKTYKWKTDTPSADWVEDAIGEIQPVDVVK